ncbi:MAG: FadR/GntR family transcriptional regulator [Candidatus Dormibacteria bacterium]
MARRVGPTQQVREQLLAALQGGDFPPGALLPSERVLCDTFGVSRVSVREAIAGLEAMGLISVRQGRGAFVRESLPVEQAAVFGNYLSMHRDELLELLKVRGALDQLAAEEACLHGVTAGVQRVLQACDAFQAAVDEASQDFARLGQMDVAFHLAIAESAGGDLLPRLLGELNGILDDSRRLTLSQPGQLARSVKQHRAIVKAILARDPKAARRAADLHLSDTRQWLTRDQASPRGH